MSTSLSNLTNVLETKMQRDVPLFINTNTPLMAVFDSKAIVKHEQFDGEYRIEFPVQFAMAEGFAWTAENAAEPTTTSPSYNKGYLNLKKGVWKHTISGEVMKLVDGKKHALASKLSEILAQATKVMKLNREAALHGNGAGRLANCVSVSSQVVTVDSTRFLRPGMRLDAYDAVPNKDADSIVVASVDSATTFTATGTVSSIDSASVLYHEDSYANGAPQGIANMVDDDTGTFQGLSRNTYRMLRALVRDGSVPGTPEAFTNDRLIALLDDVVEGPYAMIPDMLYCNTKVYNSIFSHFVATNQGTNMMESKGGIPGGLKFHYHSKDIPIVASSKADAYTLYALSKGNLGIYGDGLGGFTKIGGQLFEKVQSYDQFNIIYNFWVNFFTTFPQANGRLNDISHTGA
jgi:hypothetical protein